MNKINVSSVSGVFFVLFLLVAGSANANFLANGGFEFDRNYDWVPDSWTQAGARTCKTVSGGAFATWKAVRCGNSPYDMVYQRVNRSGGQTYELRVWARADLAGGSAGGELKLEFYTRDGYFISLVRRFFSVSDSWTKVTLFGYAPYGTERIVAGLVGYSGGKIRYDEVSLRSHGEPLLLEGVDEKQKETEELGILGEHLPKVPEGGPIGRSEVTNGVIPTIPGQDDR